jgi:ketosteroid isomerase-like protein
MRSPASGSETGEALSFDDVVTGYRKALELYVTGDAEPALAFISRRDDVTLANPLLPPQRGPEDVLAAAAKGATMLRDGSIRSFEEVSRYATPDLGYVVQVERAQAKFPGSETMNQLALRVTMIFRREEGTWKLVHRHADGITSQRPITSVVEP